MKKIINKLFLKIKESDKNYLRLLPIIIILVMPFISKKINFTEGHDFLYHISNIDAISKQINNFSLSKITPMIANNFGYGGGIFYPKLPHYIASIFATIFNSIPNSSMYSLKLTNILVIILSGYFMYILLKRIFKDKNIALLGSAFYITMPYFMTNIYVRTAFNETFVFLFMPLIMIGIIELLNKNYKLFYLYFIIGYIGLVNSHLVMGVYFTFMILIFLLINYKNIFTKENIKHLIIASTIIIAMILPSIIMMLEHKALNIYAVFDNEIMNANALNIKSNGLNIFDYINPVIRWGNDIYVFINIIVIIFSLLSFIYLVKKEKNEKRKNLVISILVCLIISILLSYKKFPYEYLPKLLLSVQFGFRFMTFVCFFISIFAAYGLNIIKQKNKDIIMKISIIICCITVLPFINNTDFKNIKELSFDYNSGMGWQKEYLTYNTIKNYDYFENRNNDIKIVTEDNDIKIRNVQNKIPNLKFDIDNVKDKATLEIPRLYYLGYDIKLINKEGKATKINYKNNKYGFISFDVNENGKIIIKYTGTLLYKISIILRYITIIILLLFILNKNRRKKYE